MFIYELGNMRHHNNSRLSIRNLAPIRLTAEHEINCSRYIGELAGAPQSSSRGSLDREFWRYVSKQQLSLETQIEFERGTAMPGKYGIKSTSIIKLKENDPLETALLGFNACECILES